MLHSAVPPRKNAFAADLVSMLVGGIGVLLGTPRGGVFEAENEREKDSILQINVLLELFQHQCRFEAKGNGVIQERNLVGRLLATLAQQFGAVFYRKSQSLHHLAMVFVLLLHRLELGGHVRASALQASWEDDGLFLVEVLFQLSPPQGQ